MLWLWLDRQFFSEVIVRGWRRDLETKRRASDDPPVVVPEESGSGLLVANAGADAEPRNVQPAPQVLSELGSAVMNRAQPIDAARSSPVEVSSSASAGLPTRQ